MNNSEILFIYDAQMCNPNGDPDEENRPRMDYATQTNLVSDVRLKRYIRDYLQEKGFDLYVQKGEKGKTVDASGRIKEVLNRDKLEKLTEQDLNLILEKLIDVRLFGATMPIKLEGKGQSIAFTGPVQFNWGYSLNKVYLLDSQSITSHFSSGEAQEQGTIGKDYRVKYSLIAFHGVISGYNARNTGLKEEDIALLDEAIVKAIPLHATRSKVGQEPRLYLRVEYNSDGFILGDFRKWLKLVKVDNKKDEELFSVKDIQLDVSQLIDELKNVQGQIEQVYLWHDKNLNLTGNINEIPGLNKM
ncbi:MAG: type I-B CRISPR-associated protein Cas7/Csh2 [Promethearchaeota archaeon]